jgi:hypothetical protein
MCALTVVVILEMRMHPSIIMCSLLLRLIRMSTVRQALTNIFKEAMFNV